MGTPSHPNSDLLSYSLISDICLSVHAKKTALPEGGITPLRKAEDL